MTKTMKIIYWVSTLWLALGMLSTGVVQLLRWKEDVDLVVSLGYPVYFLTLIGVWKIFGVVTVLIPKFPLLKEWAYAGLFFDLAGAIYSGVAASGKFDPMMLTMAIWIVPGVLSYYFWHKKMHKKEPARTKTRYETVG